MIWDFQRIQEINCAMREFGSDFHKCDLDFLGANNRIAAISGNLRYYANGRLALDALIVQEKWRRIWIPAYFCYEVIEHIRTKGIKVELYDDNPLENNDDYIVRSLPYIDGDVLLRVNYFGIRSFRNNKGICVPVIEDHSHDIISGWANNSNADWCIASIRKSLPIAAGGILWSPTNKAIPSQMDTLDLCEKMATIRYTAMNVKSAYLKNGGNKNEFREMFIQTEEMIEKLDISGMDRETERIVERFDLDKWTEFRNRNWGIVRDLLDKRFRLLMPWSNHLCNPFSVIIICNSLQERASLRQYLISKNVYPAILWQITEDIEFNNAKDFSERMLSIHCDARYNDNDIKVMCGVINSFYDQNN